MRRRSVKETVETVVSRPLTRPEADFEGAGNGEGWTSISPVLVILAVESDLQDSRDAVRRGGEGKGVRCVSGC